MGQAAMLSTTEYAEISGFSTRYAKMLVAGKKINAIESTNARGRKKYLIPLSELTEEQQLRYLQKQQEKAALPEKETEQPDVEPYSAEEREEAAFWKNLIAAWLGYRSKAAVGSKAKADEAFVAIMQMEHPEHAISIPILYRKLKAYRQNDMDGFIDQRGKWKKGQSSIDETVWQAFLYYYLDEAQPSIQRCIEYTKLWAKEVRPELYDTIPSYSSFWRRTQNDLSEYLKVLGREGEKAFDDRCAPYIRRTYATMQSNDYWIADNHTFDVMTIDRNGKRHRPYLTAFLDARSGIFTGFYVTYNPSSEATLYALRRGILKYGIPKNIYVDNGREFLTFDIGGLGHRKKKKPDSWQFKEPPGVFQRLGIKMTNAIVRNAKAKIIERRFRDVKDHFSKLFQTYTGGNLQERPERLKKVLKAGELYTDEEFAQIVETMIEGYFNQQMYNGEVAADRGKTKMEVYNEQLKEQRKAKAKDLDLMMLRSTRSQKVGRTGVYIPIGGEKLWYWNDEFLEAAFGKTVYLRYDPDDLKKVRVYDLEDRFLMEVPAENETVIEYGVGKSEVKTAMQKTRSLKKNVKEQLQAAMLAECDRKTALELVLAEAQRNIDSGKANVADAKVIKLHRAEEEPHYQKVIGGADLDIMNRNAMRKGGGNEQGI